MVSGRSDWLLAETVRLSEERAGRPLDRPAADAAGRAAGGDLAARIMTRARALDEAPEIRTDIHRLEAVTRGLFWSLISLGALSGVLAAGVAAGGAQRQVDLLLALAALAGLPTLMLLVWLAVFIAGRRRPGAGIPGALLRSGAIGLGRRLLRSPRREAVLEAAAGMLAAGGTARWGFSLLTHGFWLAYCAGALLALALLFSVLQYDLAWGTTLLNEGQVVTLVQGLAQVPALLPGVEIPAADRILAARQDAGEGDGRGIWARFLLACITSYALLPRVLLTILSAWRLRRAGRRLRLDTDQPGYLRLAPVLLPASEVAAPDRRLTETNSPPLPERRSTRPAVGDPVLVGMELERDADDWPPELPGIPVRALGRADDRAQTRALTAALARMEHPPPGLIALCALGRTPDAGTARTLAALAEAAASPLLLVVDEAGRFAARGGDVATRFAQWRELAGRLGAEALLLDTADPAPDALAQLAERIRGGAP